VADDRLHVCLDRVVELDSVRLRLRDWPGISGPLVHVPDPRVHSDHIFAALAELAPDYRVLSLSPRGDAPYQIDATDLLGTLDQFGFKQPTLVGERLGCVAALLVTAWYPDRVARLILIDPTYDPPSSDGVADRALRDCPPDWPALRAAVKCPVLVERWSATSLKTVEIFLKNGG
jgi:pimeloyl-ACP methyl ester carboxylesterase